MKIIRSGLLKQSQYCTLCQAPGSAGHALCTDCESALPGIHKACPICALPMFLDEHPCGECLQKKPSFDCVRSPLQYRYPVDDLISRLKYHHALANGRLLGEYFANYMATQKCSVDILLPLPLHPQRLSKRGFNQAAELTHWISRGTGIAWRGDILHRHTAGEAQRSTSRRNRRQNVKEVFRCSDKRIPERVAVIDDVVTTGATAEAAAHCLKQAGVKRVEIWAIARTPKPGISSDA